MMNNQKIASGHIGLNIFIRTTAIKMNPNNQQKSLKETCALIC